MPSNAPASRRLLRGPVDGYEDDSDLEQWHADPSGSFRCTRLAAAPRIVATLDAVLGNPALIACILRASIFPDPNKNLHPSKKKRQQSLEARFLGRAELVNSAWRKCVADEQLWKEICLQRYERCIGLTGVDCWKQLMRRVWLTHVRELAEQSLSGVQLMLSVEHIIFAPHEPYTCLVCTLQGQDARVHIDNAGSWRAEWDLPAPEFRADCEPEDLCLCVQLFRAADQKVASLFDADPDDLAHPESDGLAEYRGEVAVFGTGTVRFHAKLLERQVSETHRGDDTDADGGTTWVLQLSCFWLEEEATWDEATGMSESEVHSALALLNWQ